MNKLQKIAVVTTTIGLITSLIKLVMVILDIQSNKTDEVLYVNEEDIYNEQ